VALSVAEDHHFVNRKSSGLPARSDNHQKSGHCKPKVIFFGRGNMQLIMIKLLISWAGNLSKNNDIDLVEKICPYQSTLNRIYRTVYHRA
jgi:hypothetical protein